MEIRRIMWDIRERKGEQSRRLHGQKSPPQHCQQRGSTGDQPWGCVSDHGVPVPNSFSGLTGFRWGQDAQSWDTTSSARSCVRRAEAAPPGAEGLPAGDRVHMVHVWNIWGVVIKHLGIAGLTLVNI